MSRFRSEDGMPFSSSQLAERVASTPLKFQWFLQKGYEPHYWQSLFHTLEDTATGRLSRFRHLVAGRRGGKTLSAAWEILFYILHPEEFHWDIHGIHSNRPLRVWILTKDYPTGMAALLTFREALRGAGLTHGIEYKENRGNRWFEFANGAFLEFKTADDPESLRGAGLDILWMDEAAFIPSERPWQVVRPALADHQGILLTTTTPDGKNWLYDEFWNPQALEQTSQGRVEYWSIDNPYFPREEWEYLLRTYHPLLFKQEFMASFDSLMGKELSGEWLKYYTMDEIPRDANNPKLLDLNIFIGVDPAISLADTADSFAISAIGVTKDSLQAYLLDQWKGRIPFSDQLDMIHEWHLKYRPHIIGVEANAYQAALAQQAMRLPNLPPVSNMLAQGKKSERILSMTPLFKIGKIRIRKDHKDFINEWLDYDSSKKNPKDDALDSVEIALRTAGALLPMLTHADNLNWNPAASMEELILRDQPGSKWFQETSYDEHLGSEW